MSIKWALVQTKKVVKENSESSRPDLIGKQTPIKSG